ncbi:MAG TPA: M20 family metallopeptidase [Acidimicrobiales bacterium]|nr:M20 family metallopeptidase [Acidimicrobiales bacterium]
MRDHVSTGSLVEMTRALVAARSANPPGDERAVAVVAQGLLEGLGAEVTVVEGAPDRVSVIGRVGDRGSPTLLVNGHLDTVPVGPAEWAHDPFAGEVSDGRLWGRGSADMKGGVAAAIEAVHTVRRSGADLPCDVVFHLVADEERGGQLGTRVLLERGLVSGDACLVPEPTGLDICIAERGILHVDVRLHGRAAHASEPRNGISAIEKAAKVVLALHGADFGHPQHPLLGKPTANAGVIHGGTGPNVVAEHCVVTVDHRALPGQSEQDAVEDVRRLIDGIDDRDLRYELAPIVWGEASELRGDHPWVAHVGGVIAATTGREPAVIGMPFATDARFVRNQAAIPAVVCGPGEIAQAHIVDEWVSIDALVDAAAVYAALMAGFDKGTAALLG